MLGLSTSPSLEMYDLAVIGGGPAGLAAAVYGASEGLNTVLIEKADDRRPGRAAARSIENYLGFPIGVSGAELTTSARRQAERFGAEVITTREAVRLDVSGVGAAHSIEFEDGSTIGARAVILATGVDYRQLQITGCWDDPDDPACNYIGRGVYYGASVSRRQPNARRGRLHRRRRQLGGPGRDVHVPDGEVGDDADPRAVAGGGRCRSTSIERIERPRTSRPDCTEVVDTSREDDHLTGLVLLDRRTGRDRDRHVRPDVLLHRRDAAHRVARGAGIARDDFGFILSGPDLTTKVADGHWTVRRITWKQVCPVSLLQEMCASDSAKRVAAAVGEGSMAVMLVHRYLAES